MKVLFTLLIVALSISYSNAQWQQCPLYGGHIFSLATNGTTVFAGTPGDALFKSDDYGSNWYVSNSGLPANRDVYSIAIRGNEIYAGIDGNGMYKSTDNGASWDSIKTGLPAFNCSPNDILFKGTDIFVSMANGQWGVYKSSDSGNTWNSVNNGIVDSSIYCMVSDSTGIYAGSLLGGGIYKTIDNGASWFQVNTGLPSGNKVIGSLVANDTVFFAGIFSVGNGFQIYKSVDHGANWMLSSGITSEIYKLSICDDKIYIATNNGVYYSTDGVVWTSVNTGLSNTIVTTLAVNGLDIFAGTLGGVYLLSNGDSVWVSVNNGMTANKINSFSNVGNNLFAGSETAGIFLTTDNGNTWDAKNNGLSDLHIISMCTSGTSVYAGGYGSVHKTSDYGDNWSSTNAGIPFNEVNTIVASGTNVFIGTYSGVSRSFDGGTTWSASNTGLSSTDVRSITISETNDIYAAIYNVGVFMSTNNGSNWTNISNGFVGISYVNCLAASDIYIIAGLNDFNPPVITSNDYGTTWKVGSNGLFGHTVNTLRTIGNSVFAGLNDGVFYTNNNGDDWIDMSQGLPANSVTSIGRDDSCIYAGVAGHGVWKRPISDFAIDFTGNNVIDLSSNLKIYPNPVGEILFIETDENATIEIINMQGQIIETLILTDKSNSVDISGLSHGVYSLRIKTENGTTVSKLIKQ